ncbi:proline-rich protein 35 [Gastrophryne carolinensis]
MSKEEQIGCKINTTCKHKERKPKKPHYIPRPWGKPYNYKCFQCPFTCMEKSHLYNHMKYSLCKNSLSLLIESDWPYKKNNFLVPEVNLHHEAHTETNSEKQEDCDSSGSVSKPRQLGEKTASGVQMFMEEQDKRSEDEEDEATDQGQKEKSPSPHVDASKNDAHDISGSKGKKNMSNRESETEFIITDVFSLEGHHENNKEEQRYAKVPRKTSNNIGSSRLDQWKQLSNTLKKTAADAPVGCSGSNIIPCYPPPAYADYQEHQGLSLLGFNYPKNANFFSYLNPSITSGTSQLPFLASTAQLMHPAHFSQFQALQNTDRSSFLPRFYYPLLFEHTFNTSDTKVSGKPMAQSQAANTAFVTSPEAKAPVERLKTCLPKTPEVNSLHSWGLVDKLQSPTMVNNKSTQDSDAKWVPQTVREIIQQQKEILGIYGSPASRINQNSTHKGTSDGSLWGKPSPTRCIKRKTWLDRERPEVEPTASTIDREREIHNSSYSPITSPEHWGEKSPVLEVTASKRRRESEAALENSEPLVVNASLLIRDLSRTLEEYGRVEQKLANLTSADSGRQKTLSEQLGKIRLELLHIHNALEKASYTHEGPLDLSVKRTEDINKEDSVKIPLTPPPHPECSSKQVVKVERMPPELITCYARPTKCEADSSVLLCPDGRVGSSGVAPTAVLVQEDGNSVGFSRGCLQMENA